MKKLFIGKLSYSTSEASLKAAFADFAPVASVKIIIDRDTGRSKGFGFIEIEDNERAAEAIQKMNGFSLDGSNIVVNEARPQESGSRGGPSNRPPRRGGRPGFGGGSGRY